MAPSKPVEMTGSATPRLGDDVALVVVDAQVGFDDPARGPRNNHHCDRNIAGLVAAFVATDRPVVFVRHESASPASSLHPRHPGNALKPYLERHTPDLVVTKTVHSSFHGSPDLDAWLRTRRIGGLVVAGITTNHCCETTARVGANLGYAVRFVLDATHTFDLVGPDGITLTADELARATATNLHEQFATIVTTRQVVDAVGPGHDR